MTPEVLALQALVTRLGTQRKAAKHLGVSQAYVSDVLKRRRPMSERLLGKLGFQRVVVQK
jgi:predicted transcriptional regulator